MPTARSTGLMIEGKIFVRRNSLCLFLTTDRINKSVDYGDNLWQSRQFLCQIAGIFVLKMLQRPPVLPHKSIITPECIPRYRMNGKYRRAVDNVKTMAATRCALNFYGAKYVRLVGSLKRFFRFLMNP